MFIFLNKSQDKERNNLIGRVKTNLLPCAFSSHLSTTFVCLHCYGNVRLILGDFQLIPVFIGDRGSTVVKVLCCKSEGRWFDPSLCQCIFQ